MNKGRIVQVMGPVVDVVFENGDLPFIKDALEVDNNGKKCIMEVAQHLGNNEVRCLMLAASEGLCKDMEVTATGAGIQVPVGEQTLGRLFNVLGETIDNGEPITDSKKWVIHRQPPTFEDQSPVEPPSRKVATAWHTLGFDTSMCRATSTERTIPSFFRRTRMVSR